MTLYGGVEAGGSKFVCAVGLSPDQVEALEIIPTTTPEETISRVVSFFTKFRSRINAIGVGAFGLIDLNRASSRFGTILNTPKLGWAQTRLIGKMSQALHLPVVFDTDANVAALGEATWGATAGTRTSVYLTVGTGIGGGVIIDGKPLHGLLQPEFGHMRLPPRLEKRSLLRNLPLPRRLLRRTRFRPSNQRTMGNTWRIDSTQP
jgi:fructokinase